MRYAIIDRETGLVTNVMIAEVAYARFYAARNPTEILIDVTDVAVGPGWTYATETVDDVPDVGVFHEPPPPEPDPEP